MKSTGEALGCDKTLYRAFYKALKAAGQRVVNYGTVLFTIADRDKEWSLPYARRFYELGFNIEATQDTANFLKRHGIRTRLLHKISEGSEEIPDSLRAGHVTYVVNTLGPGCGENPAKDGYRIRRLAVEHNVTIFTSLDTTAVLLDVLEELTVGVSTIDAGRGDADV